VSFDSCASTTFDSEAVSLCQHNGFRSQVRSLRQLREAYATQRDASTAGSMSRLRNSWNYDDAKVSRTLNQENWAKECRSLDQLRKNVTDFVDRYTAGQHSIPHWVPIRTPEPFDKSPHQQLLAERERVSFFQTLWASPAEFDLVPATWSIDHSRARFGKLGSATSLPVNDGSQGQITKTSQTVTENG